jgi:HD-like signal output (HDOD) protein
MFSDNLVASSMVPELSPFPSVAAIKALQLASNGEKGLRELHKLISTDPVFSAELLRAANSPQYAVRASIKSTLQATMVLGYVRLKRLVLTVGLRVSVAKMLEIPVLRACWRHSVACAIVAEELATASFAAKSEKGQHLDKDFAFTAGIMHDIGRLALAVMKPQPYADFLNSIATEPCNILAKERELIGADHCQIGRHLVTAWKLPAEFLEITSCHHDDVQNSQFDATAAVRFGCMMADSLGFSVARSDSTPSYDKLVGGLPEDERRYFGPNREEYVRRIAEKVASIESA